MGVIDISYALQAKSDQLNALDIMGNDIVIRIRGVKTSDGDQPVQVYFDGDNNRPWKPSKGMLRILAAAWGNDAALWTGKYAKIYCEPSVRFGGKEVGGIRIRELSDIDERGLVLTLALNRQQRTPYHVPLLVVPTVEYPDDQFQAALPKMKQAMAAGKMTLQQVIAQCQKTGVLSAKQTKQLEEIAPVEIDEDNEEM